MPTFSIIVPADVGARLVQALRDEYGGAVAGMTNAEVVRYAVIQSLKPIYAKYEVRKRVASLSQTARDAETEAERLHSEAEHKLEDSENRAKAEVETEMGAIS